MTRDLTINQHLKNILTLGLPLIGSHVAQFSINMTDTVMLGWYDVEVLAAQVIAGTVFFVLFILGSGFAFAVMPMVAEAEAAGEGAQVRRVTRMAIWASLLYSVVAVPVMLLAEPILLLAGQTPEVARLAADYLLINGWSIIPALLVMVFKSYLSALERAGVVLWVTLAAVLINVVVNYALIFGNWGFPEMGIEGAAVASLIVNIASMLLLGAYLHWVTPEHEVFSRFWRADWEAFRAVTRLGWPMGLTSLAEVGLFAASSVMMGWLGTLPLAAHGIALQITALTFMVHLGLSNAATVRAGRAVGRRSMGDLRLGAKLVTSLSAGFAALTLVVFLVFPEPLLALFLSPEDPQRDVVIALGVPLLAAAGLFQFADAAQALALGVLRGVQDTKVPMVMAAISYWVIGVPVSYVMGFVLGWGGVGVWAGLAVGLACAGVLLMGRFWGPVMGQTEARIAKMKPAE
ncbi:MATE family efflux transporter [Thalassobius sp. MITS945101]|uniref:MATE family efflux transporter n=1 Tax=Thalassobius sp. MITS945101 TaxID=3096994 RepID=UPI003999754F